MIASHAQRRAKCDRETGHGCAAAILPLRLEHRLADVLLLLECLRKSRLIELCLHDLMPASRAWFFAVRTVLVGACLDGIACAKRESRERTQRAHAQKHRQGIAAHLVTRHPHFYEF